MVLRLKRTGNPINRVGRNDINENWDNIERDFNNVVNVISKQAYDQLVLNASLIWQEPVATFADLTTTYPNAQIGWAAWTRETVNGVSKAYRYNGSRWIEQQQFLGDAINEVDNRLGRRITENTIDLEERALNLKRLGIANDGSDITDSLESLLNSRKGVFVFPRGEYTISRPIIISQSDVKLKFHPESIIRYVGSDTTDSGFTFRGGQTEISNLNSNVNENELTLTLNSINDLNVGDWIYIETEEPVSQLSRQYDTKREFCKLTGVSPSTNQVFLATPLVFSYKSNMNTKVYKMNFLKNVSVENLNMIGTGNNLLKGVEFDKCFNPQISKCLIQDIGNIGIEIRFSIFGNVKENYVQINYSDSLQYGIVVHSSMYQTISTNTLDSARTAVDVTRVSSFISVDGNTSHRGNINTHSVRYVSFTDNVIHGGRILLRGPDMIVDGNIVHSTERSCFDIQEDGVLGNLTITNNIFRGYIGVRFLGGKNILIKNNIIEATDYESYDSTSSLFRFFSQPISNVQFVGNIVNYIGTKPQPQFMFHASTLNLANNIRIENNDLTGGETCIGISGATVLTPVRKGLRISENSIKCNNTGIEIRRFNDVRIENNDIEHLASGTLTQGIYEFVPDALYTGRFIVGNTIKNATSPLRFIRSGNITVDGCIVKDNVYYNSGVAALSAFESENSIIKDNLSIGGL